MENRRLHVRVSLSLSLKDFFLVDCGFTGASIHPSVNQFINQSINESVNQSINQSINYLINFTMFFFISPLIQYFFSSCERTRFKVHLVQISFRRKITLHQHKKEMKSSNLHPENEPFLLHCFPNVFAGAWVR
jgi:hypothetical protein